MAKKKAGQRLSTNIRDYPDGMSQYEKESLVAEAILAAERKIRKRPKPAAMAERKGYKTTSIARVKAAVSTVRSNNNNKASREAKLAPKQVFSIRCPTCGAARGMKCELTTGLPRTAPHRDRRLIARD